MATFFLRVVLVLSRGLGCDNIKCGFKLGLGWVLSTRAELSTFPQPNRTTSTDTVVFGTLQADYIIQDWDPV